MKNGSKPFSHSVDFQAAAYTAGNRSVLSISIVSIFLIVP